MATTTQGRGESESLQQNIIDEAPRLGKSSRFRFRCHPGVDCFNRCCADVNIVLTPYDALRLRKALGLGSAELMTRYTIQPFTKEQRLPVLLLKMRDDEGKTCPFVGPKGCEVYEDRPWSCRMYPVGKASSGTSSRVGEEFFFVLSEDHCHGHREQQEWSIAEWLEDQGVAAFDAFGDRYRDLVLHERLLTGEQLGPAKMDMYFMACYDLDRFRRFVFESRFLQRFEVDSSAVEKIRTDDEALLNFGVDWLRFSLCGEPTMRVRPEVLEARKRALSDKPTRSDG